jgi:hypothetical protein
VGTLGGGRLRRHELDHVLEGEQRGVGPPALVQVAAQAVVEARGAQRVARLDQLDRLPCELDRAWRRSGLAGELGRQGAEPGQVEAYQLGRAGHVRPQRQRPLGVRERLRQAEGSLRLASRLDRRDQRLSPAAGGRPVVRELRRRRGRAAREFLREPGVELLALAGQDRGGDRLRQQRVAEPEAAGRLLGDQHAVVDRLAQRLAHLALGEPRDGGEQRVADVASGGRGQAQQAPRPVVEPGHALEQQVAQATRERTAPLAAGVEQLLGEEGVALGAGDDRRRERRRQRRVGVRLQQRCQLIVAERAELQHQRRARAAHATGQPAHAPGRGVLVRAVGPELEDRQVVQVVGEEDDQVERGGVGPVEVLQHQQQRRAGRALAEQRERLLEQAQPRAGRPRLDVQERAQGSQRLGERLERQLRADQVDRAAEQHLEALAAGTAGQIGREPGLADARFPGDQHGPTLAGPRRVERPRELLDLAPAPDEQPTCPSFHPGSIAPLAAAWKAPAGTPRRQDKAAGSRG